MREMNGVPVAGDRTSFSHTRLPTRGIWCLIGRLGSKKKSMQAVVDEARQKERKL